VCVAASMCCNVLQLSCPHERVMSGAADSMLQCVAVYCSTRVLQCVALVMSHEHILLHSAQPPGQRLCVAVCCSVLQHACTAVCCTCHVTRTHFAPQRSTAETATVCCIVLQCVAMCCSTHVLQCVALVMSHAHTFLHSTQPPRQRLCVAVCYSVLQHMCAAVCCTCHATRTPFALQHTAAETATMCCSLLQRVAARVCCSVLYLSCHTHTLCSAALSRRNSDCVLQFVAACCSTCVLQCVALVMPHEHTLLCSTQPPRQRLCVVVCCSVLQHVCVAVCCTCHVT